MAIILRVKGIDFRLIDNLQWKIRDRENENSEVAKMLLRELNHIQYDQYIFQNRDHFKTLDISYKDPELFWGIVCADLMGGELIDPPEIPDEYAAGVIVSDDEDTREKHRAWAIRILEETSERHETDLNLENLNDDSN